MKPSKRLLELVRMSTALCTLTVRFLCGFAVKALSIVFCASKGPMALSLYPELRPTT